VPAIDGLLLLRLILSGVFDLGNFDRRHVQLDDVPGTPDAWRLLQLLYLCCGRGACLGDVVNPEVIHGVNLALELGVHLSRDRGNAAQLFGRLLQFLQESALVGVGYDPENWGSSSAPAAAPADGATGEAVSAWNGLSPSPRP